MKDIFKGYYNLGEHGFRELWKRATFIFDTNVLLNLYRYQSSTKNALITVMEKLSDRVWIPYHVGLEFQRNRLFVIAEQHKRYSEVRSIVTKSIAGMQGELESLQLKKRHSHINPDKLIDSIAKIKTSFFEELESLEEKSISVSSNDAIRERIDSLFNGKIGGQPGAQEILDAYFNEGEQRFKDSIPPGFMDSTKDEKKPDKFIYGGLLYKRKYGDLIVWKQIIEHAISSGSKDIIFVTDDNKADWWQKIDSNGPKTIGPRPELTDEISREAGVERFHIYNTEGFLSYANELLDAKVTEEAIKEVRELSIARREFARSPRSMREMAMSTEKAVYEWLSDKFDKIEHNRGFPDFVAYQDDLKFGFEVKMIRDPRMIMHRLDETVYRAYYSLNEDGYYEIALIFVVLDVETVDRLMHMIKRRMPDIDGNLRIIVGMAEFDEEEGVVYGFIPYDEVHTKKRM